LRCQLITVSDLTMIKDSHSIQTGTTRSKEAVLVLNCGVLLNSLKDNQLLPQGEVFKGQITSVF